MALDPGEIVKNGATAALFANVLVNLLKASPIPSPSVVLPIAAFVLSEGCAFLLLLADDQAFTRQSIAVTILVGIAATGAAVIAKVASNAAEK